MKSPALFFALLLAAAPSAEAKKGGNGNGGGGNGGGDVAETFVLEVQYCWGATSVDPACPIATMEFYGDGTFMTTWIDFPPFYSEPADSTGTWKMKGNGRSFDFDFDGSPATSYSGSLDNASGCYVGEMSNDDGMFGAWEGC